jgi:uncharacterized membrane protein
VSASVLPITATALPQRSVRPQGRLQRIDILRGAIILIMAVDHVRDFFHSAAPNVSSRAFSLREDFV